MNTMGHITSHYIKVLITGQQVSVLFGNDVEERKPLHNVSRNAN